MLTGEFQRQFNVYFPASVTASLCAWISLLATDVYIILLTLSINNTVEYQSDCFFQPDTVKIKQFNVSR